jgi:uncharacterized protein (TIGR03083 family)
VSLVPIDWARLQGALDRAADRIAELLRAAPDGNAKVTGLDWTVSDLGAHLINEADRFERFGRGQNQTLDDVARTNADEIASVSEREPSSQADLFAAAHARYSALAAQHAGTDPYTWFDQPLEWAEAGGIYLGELKIHAVDLARTLGRRVTIDHDDAITIAYGLLPILPRFVDKQRADGFTGTYKLKLRGAAPIMMRFENGELSVTSARTEGDSADCTISADPESFLLVGYGRTSQWGAILRGKLFASGRKPWLGLRFSSLLMNP